MSPRDRVDQFFAKRGWKPWTFQTETWQAYLDGQSGVINVPTGTGKTFAAMVGPILELRAGPRARAGLHVLYLSPLKAVSRDIEKALVQLCDEIEAPVSIGTRTGDTSSYRRSKQKEKLPNILITTPESLALLLAYENSRELFANIRAVIVDEWHELLSTKRGTQTELLLARLRAWSPHLRTWGLSATLGNIEQAAAVLCPDSTSPRIITADVTRKVNIASILPPAIDHFPWAGHLGLTMLAQVVQTIDIKRSTLLFTNTRSFAERWYKAILEARPDWEDLLAIHHGSLAREERERVESGIKSGALKLVVTTSSLDLGVDFPEVEAVYQVGSPKGVGRIIQRAGRASHRPGEPCHLTFVPTHAIELVEISALRRAVDAGEVESRLPLRAPLDVLAQHLVGCALAGGFVADEMYAEVRRAYSYAELPRDQFDWTMGMVSEGGHTLRAYPEYCKLANEGGRWRVTNPRVSQLFRLNVGTISSDASVQVCFMKGQRIGQVEEQFIAKMKRGDRFHFAGRTLSFVVMKDMKAYVKLAADSGNAVTARWMGSRIPLSSALSRALREEIDRAARGEFSSVEMRALEDLFRVQAEISRIPTLETILAETLTSRDGHHLFLYPFEGRQVHEGLAALLALRFAKREKSTFSLAMNDYGIEFVATTPFDFAGALREPGIFRADNLFAEILDAVNLSELARRQFREIARVAGLTFQNYGSSRKHARQVQASAGLIFDVLKDHDPENLFIKQAENEVRDKQFEESRLRSALDRLAGARVDLVALTRPSPLAFPLIVDRMGARVSSENLGARIARMKEEWLDNKVKRRRHGNRN